MIEFTIQIAGRVVTANVLFESTREYCRAYLCDGAADFSIAITPEDITYERQKAMREDALEGLPPRNYSDTQLETTAVLRKITEGLFAYDTLLFHGSVVAVDGEAYLFSAKSGTGKSTHAALWRRMLGDRAVMVNDDKPFLRITEEGIVACGSPWNGKHGLGSNIAVPLKAICLLERGTENRIRKIDAKDALFMLLQQSCRPAKAANMPRYMALLDTLAGQTAFYRLQCNTELEAAEVSYRAMSENKE